jgi:hypothetical protein
MHNFKLTRTTASMVYTGTLLLSILSFFTTYYGLRIILNVPLAMAGSLGLQIAMLGLAWSLMRQRRKRATYVTVFSIAAAFSIFFSYANFDANFKMDARATDVRADYTETARPILAEYSSLARRATWKGSYQVDRLNKLVLLELQKGWTTFIDEGAQDRFIQESIEGARRTVTSWEQATGQPYRQGSGSGLIINYLQGRARRASKNLKIAESYAGLVDSFSTKLNSGLPVEEQYEMVNMAWAKFPIGEIDEIMGESSALPAPVDVAGFVEKPQNRQQAFMLVLDDLIALDRLAVFSMLLAIGVDLVVILIAFAGSRAAEDADVLMDRLRQETAIRLSSIAIEDEEEFSEALEADLRRLQRASKYRLAWDEALSDYERKKKDAVVLRRGPEGDEKGSSEATRTGVQEHRRQIMQDIISER